MLVDSPNSFISVGKHYKIDPDWSSTSRKIPYEKDLRVIGDELSLRGECKDETLETTSQWMDPENRDIKQSNLLTLICQINFVTVDILQTSDVKNTHLKSTSP